MGLPLANPNPRRKPMGGIPGGRGGCNPIHPPPIAGESSRIAATDVSVLAMPSAGQPSLARLVRPSQIILCETHANACPQAYPPADLRRLQTRCMRPHTKAAVGDKIQTTQPIT